MHKLGNIGTLKVLSIITFRTGLKTTFQKMVYFDLLFLYMMIKYKFFKTEFMNII